MPLSLYLFISHTCICAHLCLPLCVYINIYILLCHVSLPLSLPPLIPTRTHARKHTQTESVCATHHSHMSTLNKCAHTESWVLLRLLQKFEMESRSKLAVTPLNFSLPFSRARSLPPIASLRGARDFDICICVCARMCALI